MSESQVGPNSGTASLGTAVLTSSLTSVGTLSSLSVSGKTTVGTTTTNTSDAFTIVDPGNAFMSIRSDAIALGNYQILDFATGTNNRASANMTGSIAAEIMDTSPLKSDLCFSTNKGDSITQSLKLRSSGTLESFVPSDATPNFKFRSDDVNWHGYLNQTVEGSTISTTLSCAGSWTVNGTTYDATKDFNGSFATLAMAIHNQYNGGEGGFVFLNKAGGSTTTDGAVTELLRIKANGQVSIGDAPSSGQGLLNIKPGSSDDSYLKFRRAADFNASLDGTAIDSRNSANNTSKDLILRADTMSLWLGAGTERARFTDGSGSADTSFVFDGAICGGYYDVNNALVCGRVVKTKGAAFLGPGNSTTHTVGTAYGAGSMVVHCLKVADPTIQSSFLYDIQGRGTGNMNRSNERIITQNSGVNVSVSDTAQGVSITNNETFTIKYAITIDITGDVLPS